jgi:hypothetical protein
MKNVNIVVVIVLLLVIGGGAFFGGMKYQQGQTLAQRTQMAGQFGNRAGGSARTGAIGARGGQVMGTILSQEANSITVKLADGSSKIVLILGTTSINQATAATAADLKVGDTVSAFGATNTDGSVTAQNIQINPIMRIGAPSGTPQK